jgi:23S rRNA pseudouridine1911/1915/1917 synthase
VEALQVLYQDKDLVVCCKPRGLLSQAGGEVDMISRLQSQLGGDVYPVHRLDREVGGVMVYARTKDAAAALSQSIQAGMVKKEYLAVVLGVPEPENGILEDLLLHDARKNKSYVVKRMRNGVRKARLSYQVLETREGKSLVQVRLFTGRTHQIRVQFASRQLPLQGDGRYGGGSGKIALWSVRLTFPHPRTKKLCSFCLLPETLGEFQSFPPLAEME